MKVISRHCPGLQHQTPAVHFRVSNSHEVLDPPKSSQGRRTQTIVRTVRLFPPSVVRLERVRLIFNPKRVCVVLATKATYNRLRFVGRRASHSYGCRLFTQKPACWLFRKARLPALSACELGSRPHKRACVRGRRAWVSFLTCLAISDRDTCRTFSASSTRSRSSKARTGHSHAMIPFARGVTRPQVSVHIARRKPPRMP